MKTWRYIACAKVSTIERDVNQAVRELGHQPSWTRYDAGDKGLVSCRDCNARLAIRRGDTVDWYPQAVACKGAA